MILNSDVQKDSLISIYECSENYRLVYMIFEIEFIDYSLEH